MKKLRVLHKAPLRVLKINRKSSKLRFRRLMLRLRQALAQEKAETKIMLAIYRKHTFGKATKEELTIANKQFIDILKGLGLGIFAILPLAPITIPIIVKLARLVGVDLIPSAFTQPEHKIKKPPEESL
ncbi:MAG: hypothetical protein ACSHW0_07160 [Thalassotalea sp.]